MSSVSQATTDSDSRASSLKNHNAKLVVLFVGLLVIVFLVFLLARATDEEVLNFEYGKRHGPQATDSVNGTNILARIFDGRGFDVTTWRRLSPDLTEFDIVVWFPDSFRPPSLEERDWFENWFLNKPFRTLVYVGRDYDALTAYIEMMSKNSAGEEQSRMQELLDKAKAKHTKDRIAIPSDEDVSWFRLRRGGAKRKVQSLQGEWADDVYGLKTWIEIQSQITPLPNRDTKVLLRSGQSDVLAMEITDDAWGYGSKIIVVTNGSFLLNVALVNHEHRKLAAKLVDRCGQPRDVVFLESGSQGAPIYEDEPKGEAPTWEAMATTWPFGAILMQCAVLGIIVCFAVAPIFGTPRELRSEGQTDFGNHIDALGRMLSRIQNRSYAQSQLNYYHDKVRRDSGMAHGEGQKMTRLLLVEFQLEGLTFATAEETATRDQFEAEVVRRGVGKIVGSTSGLGKLQITIEVENEPLARQALQAIIRELQLEYRTTVTTQQH